MSRSSKSSAPSTTQRRAGESSSTSAREVRLCVQAGPFVEHNRRISRAHVFVVFLTSRCMQEKTISYSAERIVDNGSFGVVFQARVVETGEVVAIKKVLQDKRFKVRE